MEDARDRFVNVFLFVYPYCRMRCRYCVDGLTNKAAEISRDDVMTYYQDVGRAWREGALAFGREGLLSPYALDYIQAAKGVGITISSRRCLAASTILRGLYLCLISLWALRLG